MSAYLFDCWKEIEEKIKRSASIFLLSDYDGTLTPIVERPELAALDKQMKYLLESLSRREGYKLGIISGRSLRDVKKLVGIEGIYYAGNHGFEIEGPETKLVHSAAEKVRPKIKEICTKLKKIDANGAIVEDKGLTASLHYRLVFTSDVPRVEKAFRDIVKPCKEVKITKGNKVWEVRPGIEWDKGKAVLSILNAIGEKNVLTIYMGDDLTDEDAFEALANKGITILVSVSKKESKADYFLKNVDDVKRFLEVLSVHSPLG